MPRETIAVDLDDTLCPTYQTFHGKFGLGMLVEQYIRDISQDTKEAKAATISWLTRSINEIMPKMKPVEGSVDAIEQLSHSHELVIVTGRPTGTQEVTRAWLDEQYPNKFDHVFFSDRFNPERRSKREICQAVGALALIDDTPRQNMPRETAHLVFGEYVLWTPSKPGYNEVKVRNWQEVLRYFGNGDGQRVPSQGLQPSGLNTTGAGDDLRPNRSAVW